MNKRYENTFINRLIAVPFYFNLLKEHNSLQTKYDTLIDQTKDEVFSDILQKASEPTEVLRYKAENKRLRKKIAAQKIVMADLLKEHKSDKKHKKT